MSKPTLVIMAAGLGSRYGGLKQIDPIGPNGEILIDYSIYDAKKAGFGKVVFIIKEDINDLFLESIGRRIEKQIDTEYVFQNTNNLPIGFSQLAERTKPWGTAHALLCCKDTVNTPFAVINADDYYGPSSYKVLCEYLNNIETQKTSYQYCMVGFVLENTLTESGHVARGICSVNSAGYLKEIHERTKIKRFGVKSKYTEDDKNWITIPPKSTVSMNAWGFSTDIFAELKSSFPIFLEKSKDKRLTAEYFLPEVVGNLITEKKASVKVLPSQERWYGVTYQEDKPILKQAILEMIQKGIYHERLWGNN